MSIEDIEKKEVKEICEINKMFTSFEIWASRSYNSELLTYYGYAYDVPDMVNKFTAKYPLLHIEYIK